MDRETIDYIIEKLTMLLIQADRENKSRGKVKYVSQVQAYTDLIKLFKSFK